MRRPLLVPAVLLALAAAPAARAEPVLALRLGIAGALGSAVADVPIGDAVALQVPFQLDALWRVGALAGGLYASFAPAFADCEGQASCGARIVRVGLQGTYTFSTPSGAEPWLGVATGWEWSTAERRSGGTVKTSYDGPELLGVQGGIEWRLARWLALGPYAVASLGWYSRVSVDTGFDSASVSVPDAAVHVWLHAGVRGRLLFGEARR